jgi:hypothetical protein
MLKKGITAFWGSYSFKDQYSIPFPFLLCDKRKAEILRVDSNKRFVHV